MADKMAGVYYEPTGSEDNSSLCDFVSYSFWPREPMSLGLHLTSRNHLTTTMKCMLDYDESGVSFLVRDKKNNVIGCELSKLLTRKDRFTFSDIYEGENFKKQLYEKLRDILDEKVDFFKKFKVKKLLSLAILCVDEEHGRRGIGRKLVELSEESGRRAGAEMIVTQATSLYSQKIFDRLGFETYFVLDYGSYEEEYGKVFDLGKLGENTCAKIMAKRI